jgi:hypothetical protein
MNRPKEQTPAKVAATPKQAEEALCQKWFWAESSVWTDRLLTALEHGVKGTSSSTASTLWWQPSNCSVSLAFRNHRLESRMRENRPSGSEGGVAQSNAPSLPLSRNCRRSANSSF